MLSLNNLMWLNFSIKDIFREFFFHNLTAVLCCDSFKIFGSLISLIGLDVAFQTKWALANVSQHASLIRLMLIVETDSIRALGHNFYITLRISHRQCSEQWT